ncbi:Uncharacterised protein [Mycoplasmopsis maculosa]|uniref:Uncharacterized protein n=1 Tax=Mycoplasmopsis maculosa TaxID=114885 RepID=A0A449B555_9BACT|nr:variable surface lipoprotein [Mycoplasmopsis maculosa]VEU75658.1 Uncharacterised protein [Mycoplasmopsis maculosa]
MNKKILLGTISCLSLLPIVSASCNEKQNVNSPSDPSTSANPSTNKTEEPKNPSEPVNKTETESPNPNTEPPVTKTEEPKNPSEPVNKTETESPNPELGGENNKQQNNEFEIPNIESLNIRELVAKILEFDSVKIMDEKFAQGRTPENVPFLYIAGDIKDNEYALTYGEDSVRYGHGTAILLSKIISDYKITMETLNQK